jgi:hypothetical protein
MAMGCAVIATVNTLRGQTVIVIGGTGATFDVDGGQQLVS